ncbi:HK97 family phage prohead protease [Mycolicibacterium sp. CH28]|uniref:HK97 family phage prohead protease n=1 Tax=Mycolicibacterium sp. CH28 TaxID=2512237 RepID=UPI0010804DCE|nr:HK97 family phage prohead protease [Mycolicibacterium sp. CH28]TGD85133.1 HK97 family phage prohead protease [Mycolicibacterium sp. CH28]
MTDIERRFATLETSITRNRLVGYAVVYDQLTDLGPCLERIAPTAFNAVLTKPNLDVLGLLNHNRVQLLARMSNDSLRLSSDAHGLEFEMKLLETTLANDVRAMVESKLITGCSFGFYPGEADWSVHESRELWTHTSVAGLEDVSVVNDPQYQGTSVSLRFKPPTKPYAPDLRTQVARITAHSKG